MYEEFIESATKAVLTMATAMLLYQSDALDELHQIVEQSEATVPRHDPMTESYIDQLEQSQTIHLGADTPLVPDESGESFRLIRTTRPVRQRDLRDAPGLYRSYEAPPPMPLAETPDAESRPTITPPRIGHRKPLAQRFIRKETAQSQPPVGEVESFRIVRPARTPVRFEQSAESNLERSYIAPRTPAAYQTPRRPIPISPGEDLDAVTMPDESLLSFAGSPAEESFRIARSSGRVGWRDHTRHSGLYGSYTAAQQTPVLDESSFRISRPAGGIQRRHVGYVDPGNYRSFESTHPIRTRPLPNVSTTENLDSILLNDTTLPSFAESSRHRNRSETPQLSCIRPDSTRRAYTTFNEPPSVPFPELSRMPPTIRRSSTQEEEVTEQEYLHDIEPDFAPELNSTILSENGGSQLDETIYKLLNRISRQVEIIRADERVGILRRSSDDYDFELGRMRD
ncbi:uncharacterized protein LOC129717518 isoform X2 [Wyeomyia smithii]|uniref:uncharacterized protein LOC129717518 isoform X2 n=1 Tax=Wyeomyia smithii TaxID=174621 RepID=UPI002467E61B|nr:uncharacterized protein LOC129717518 isoform X2 [Wyeomyia smithii]